MYTFSIGALILGIAIMAAGAAFIRFHKQLAHTFGGGVGSYDRYKLWGLIITGVGVLLMFNIPAFLIRLIFSPFFGA